MFGRGKMCDKVLKNLKKMLIILKNLGNPFFFSIFDIETNRN